jgi:hypothetical protein
MLFGQEVNMDIEVKCIKKTNRSDPHERIHGIGGLNADGSRWYLPENDAIAGIDLGKWRFWTAGGGKSVWVVIATHAGRRYLKTEPDGFHPNNLLSLPECP